MILAIPTSKEYYIKPPEPIVEALQAPTPIVKHKHIKWVKPVVNRETQAYINDIFKENATIATAVLIHEGGLKLDAKNWNCRYNGKSKSCKKEDRHLAWSVDCGLAQINIKGQVCPKELLTLEGNMKAVERIYKEQGLNAWVSFTNKKYLLYL